MADDVDIANDRIEQVREQQAEQIRRNAAKFEKGKAGYCDECGEHAWRLVRGKCAPCRDELGLG